MNKIKHLTEKERNEYSGVYSDLIMSMEEIKPFIDLTVLRRRPYYNKINKLREYLEAVDEADYKADGSGFFERFKNDDIYINEVYALKAKIKPDLDKLVNCSKCKCSKCFKNCPHRSCINCEPSRYVIACDNDYMIYSDSTTRTLFDNDNKVNVTFRTEGILYELSTNKNYILMVDVNNSNNQHLLELIQLLNGNEEFGQLDKETLNRIYNIFVDFGVSV